MRRSKILETTLVDSAKAIDRARVALFNAETAIAEARKGVGAVPAELVRHFPLKAIGGDVFDATGQKIAELNSTRLADALVDCTNAGAGVSQ